MLGLLFVIQWVAGLVVIIQITHVNHSPIFKFEAQKNTRPGKGTSALSSWFHPNLVMNAPEHDQPPQARNIITLIGIRYRGSGGELY
jgi:hypothetical protein